MVTFPHKDPILRIETGQHNGPLLRMSTDRAGRFLLTVGGDKTARVWNARNGALLRVLRPPIALQEEGLIFAATISPDGSEAVLAGEFPFCSRSAEDMRLEREKKAPSERTPEDYSVRGHCQ